MKRLLWLLLAVLVSVGLLSGCGSPQVKPDYDQIQKRSQKSFQELRREEERERPQEE